MSKHIPISRLVKRIIISTCLYNVIYSLVVQACAFLNTYAHLRGYCQESSYNIGRAMHQLGLLPAALHYYKQVLATKPVVEDPKGIYDLKREAAHNIALIYKSSGSVDYARMYLQKYIVV